MLRRYSSLLKIFRPLKVAPALYPSAERRILVKMCSNGNSSGVLERIHLRWDLTVQDIENKTESLISTTNKLYDEIGKIDKDDVTFENIMERIAEHDREFTVERNNLDFYQSVHPNKELRDAGTESDKKLSELEIEISMRQDVFDRILAVQERVKDMKLHPESKRFIERMVKLGERNGLRLNEDDREKVKAIKKEITRLEIDFAKNLSEESSSHHFDKKDLDGVPEDILNSLSKTEDGKMILTLKYPHYFPIMKKCKVESTRKKMEYEFNCRCKKENTAILTELVKLRAAKAAILGFDTHAAFVHDMRMAKKPENVKKFLKDLAEKLQPLGESDREIMLKLKKQECMQEGMNFDNKINMWDLRYYMTKIEETQYTVDHEKLKQYFPMEVVTEGLLAIYEKLLGLKFEKVDGVALWHEEVTMYTVTEVGSKELLGVFFLDLFPREGKYGHAACFGLQSGCYQADGKRQLAAAAMVANFAKPTADAPSLLTHDEVETFFHEFGHVMHQICSKTKYDMFSGTHVERDFVEAPSQMLENWCWEPEALKKMSKHYKDGSEIPQEMMEKLINSRNANVGVFLLRQVALSTLDLNIHTASSADVAKAYADACREIICIEASEGTCMPATFNHLGGGYDAQYYGYLWSDVFCFDMYCTRFKKEGIFNPDVGCDYRKKILERGGSMDAADMLKDFLGREPNQDAFLKVKGLIA